MQTIRSWGFRLMGETDHVAPDQDPRLQQLDDERDAIRQRVEMYEEQIDVARRLREDRQRGSGIAHRYELD